MQTLVVDANFLMSAYRFKVDAIEGLRELVSGSYRLITPSSVIRELERISQGKGAAAIEARYALMIIEKERVEVVGTEESADSWIEEYCSSTGAIACTNDAELRRRLKSRGLRSIVLKGRSRLDYA
jgi:uncharacterized protein